METCNHVSCDFQCVCVCVLFYTEEPFFLKEVYLPTGCSDCLLAYEEIISGKDTFITLLLMSKKQTTCDSRAFISYQYRFLSVTVCGQTFSHLFCCPLFPGRERSVSPDVVETLKKQAECLQLPPPIMIDPNYGESFNAFLNTLCHYYAIWQYLFKLYYSHTQKYAPITSRPLRASVP